MNLALYHTGHRLSLDPVHYVLRFLAHVLVWTGVSNLLRHAPLVLSVVGVALGLVVIYRTTRRRS